MVSRPVLHGRVRLEQSVRGLLLLVGATDVDKVAGDGEARAERRLLVTRVRDAATRGAREGLGVAQGVADLGSEPMFSVRRQVFRWSKLHRRREVG